METGIVAVWVAVRWLSGGTQLDQDYWQTVGRCSRMTEGGKILETLVFQMTNMAMQLNGIGHLTSAVKIKITINYEYII